MLLCPVPAFYLAWVIGSLFSKELVLRYFEAGSPKYITYSVAEVSVDFRPSSGKRYIGTGQNNTLESFTGGIWCG